jgi:NAD+ kinase
MRIALRGRNLEDVIPLLEPFPTEIDDAIPEVVLTYGGDGALLGAEREFPGVPKFPLRDSRSSAKCEKHAEESVLSAFFTDQLKRDHVTKVQAVTDDGYRAVGLNDVIIDRENPASAIRYRIWIDGSAYADHIVGDGLVLASPFGSSGYYRSITHSLFTIGLGLAFNNATEVVNHLVMKADSEIRVEILRGTALLFADNDTDKHRLETGDAVTLARAPETATIIGLDVFRCSACYWHRHHHSRPLVPIATARENK